MFNAKSAMSQLHRGENKLYVRFVPDQPILLFLFNAVYLAEKQMPI
jgi:hypothetical protein